MDFKTLEAFCAVARLGNLRQAANRIGRTIPAVSIQIRKLEEEIAIPLFHHTPNRLLLTEQGRRFLKEIDGIFEALERAKAMASPVTHEFAGSISLALGSDMSRYFAPRIAVFARTYPDVHLSLISGPTSRSLALVTEHEADLGVGFYRTIPRGLRKIKIMETGIALVVPKASAAWRRSRPTLRQIAEERVIMLSRASETRRMIDSVFASVGHEPANIIEVASCQSALEFVGLGLGVGLVHSICACAENRRDTTQIELSEHFGKLEVGLITRPDILVRPAHAAFIETLTSGS